MIKVTQLKVISFFINARCSWCICLFTTNLELYDRVFGKFDSTSVANASMVIRVNEIIFYYELWKSNLGYMLLGAGATNAYNFVMGQHFIADVFFEGSTQTTLRELASFGVVFTFIRLCLFYRFSKIFCKRFWRELLLY